MALIKDGVIYRNLQQQVGKNKDDIEELQEGKQDKLIAGANITINENNVISASGGELSPVWGSIEGDINDQSDLMQVVADLEEEVDKKSPELIAGTNITLTEVGDKIQVSATGGVSSVEWGDITGDIEDQTDLATFMEDTEDSITSLSQAINNRATKVEFDAEVTRAQAAEQAINDKIGSGGDEKEDGTIYGYLNDLQLQVNEEVSYRIDGDTQLDGKIIQVAADLSDEESRATGVEAGLNTRLTTAEQTISGKQDALSAGTGITITNNTVNVDTTVIATKESVDNERSGRIATDNTILTALGGLKFQAVTSLPANPDQNTIYFITGA